MELLLSGGGNYTEWAPEQALLRYAWRSYPVRFGLSIPLASTPTTSYDSLRAYAHVIIRSLERLSK